MKKFIIFIFVFLILITPVVSFAVEPPPSHGLIPCDGADCTFDSFMTLINTVINFILYDLAIPIAAIMFMYAGYLLVTAGGEAAHARTKAKGIFFNAVLGLVLAAAAWLIIKTILSILGFDGAWIFDKFSL